MTTNKRITSLGMSPVDSFCASCRRRIIFFAGRIAWKWRFSIVAAPTYFHTNRICFFLCGYEFAPVLTHHYEIPGTVDRGRRDTRERTLYNIWKIRTPCGFEPRCVLRASGAPERRILYIYIYFFSRYRNRVFAAESRFADNPSGPAAVYPDQTSPCSLSNSSSRVRLLFIQFFVYYFNANVSTCVWFT